jgi:Uma2 family endonuclease
MSTQPRSYLTPQQYLEIERAAERRSEYYNGEMFLMAGGSKKHGKITENMSRALGNALEDKPCFAYSRDLRLWVAASGLYTYPDIMVVCEPEESSPDDPDSSLTNPSVIVEVLSPSTEGYDRGKKFGHYLKLPSLRDYILVSQEEVRIDHYTIKPGSNPVSILYLRLDDVLELPSIGVSIPLSEIYRKTDLAAS